MNRDTMIIIIASLFFLVVVTYTSVKKQRNALAENKLALEMLKTDAIELDSLKKKWKERDLTDKLLNQLKTQKVTKDEKSGKSLVLEFQNLQKDEVDNITNKILNSTMKIKELTISKSSEFNATIGLKVSI